MLLTDECSLNVVGYCASAAALDAVETAADHVGNAWAVNADCITTITDCCRCRSHIEPCRRNLTVRTTVDDRIDG